MGRCLLDPTLRLALLVMVLSIERYNVRRDFLRLNDSSKDLVTVYGIL